MKIVLLGATGQLGQEWQAVLRKRGDNQLSLLPYNSDQLDVTDPKKLAKELKDNRPDVVINCAAYTDVDGAQRHLDHARNVNAKATFYLAELSSKLDYKLLHYSTDYIFPGTIEDKDRFPKGYPEYHPADPINSYGQTKWEGEQAIRNSTDNYLIMRVSWLCGQFGSNFVKTMLQLGRDRNKLQVVDDQWGSPTYAENVVENCLNLLNRNIIGTFHLTSKGLINWYDFASAIFEKARIDVEVEAVSSDQFPTAAERPHFSKLNPQKIVDVPGSKIIHWKRGLQNLLNQLPE